MPVAHLSLFFREKCLFRSAYFNFLNLFIFIFLYKNFIYFFIQQVLISHQFYTHQCIHVNPNCTIHHTTTPTPPRLSPLGVHTFVLYTSVSVSALQTGSSVPFSSFHIYVLIYGIYFSLSDLTSLCMTVSRSIHISTNDPISFLFMAE